MAEVASAPDGFDGDVVDGTTSRHDLADASEDALCGARDPEAFAGEEAARETDDAATAAAVAAAGAELDAFLASAARPKGGGDEDADEDVFVLNEDAEDASARRSERVRRSEEAFAEVLARRDRAKAAIGEFSRRVEDVQRELNALDEEEDLERLEEEIELEGEEEERARRENLDETASTTKARDDYDDDEWAEYGGASHSSAIGTSTRLGEDGAVFSGETARSPPERRRDRANANETKKASLAAERERAANLLSREKRQLARLVPEMQRARKEMHEADRDASLFETFASRQKASADDAAADRRRRARARRRRPPRRRRARRRASSRLTVSLWKKKRRDWRCAARSGRRTPSRATRARNPRARRVARRASACARSWL